METALFKKACWISPSGELLDVSGSTHFRLVLQNPQGFGLSEKKLQNCYQKYKESYGNEGAACKEILLKLIKKGFIQVRKQANTDFWLIRLHRLNRRNRDFMKQLARKLYDVERSFEAKIKIERTGRAIIETTLLDILIDRLEKNWLKKLPERIYQLSEADVFLSNAKAFKGNRFVEGDYNTTPENFFLISHFEIPIPKKPEGEKNRKLTLEERVRLNAEGAKRKLPHLTNLEQIEKQACYQKNYKKLKKRLNACQNRKWQIATKENIQEYYILCKKWNHRVGRGWYGFALGGEVPLEWLRTIDQLLEFIEEFDPGFEIHQIKIKFGGLRFYVQTDLDISDLRHSLEKSFYIKELEY